MSAPQPRPARERRHLYLVPPLSESSESETPSKSAPTGFPWDIPTPSPRPWGMPAAPAPEPYSGRPAYVHSIPPSLPAEDHDDHPARRRIVWDRTSTDQEDN